MQKETLTLKGNIDKTANSKCRISPKKGWERSLVLLCLSVLLLVPVMAKDGPTFRDRLFFGGNFGLVIGNYTDIEVSPLVGYFITPRLSVGLGISYEYYNNKYHWWVPASKEWERFETNIWGGRLFANYVIVNNLNDWIPLGLNFRIFAHAEYEALSYEKAFFNSDGTGRKLFNNFLVGGGFRFPMGARSSMNLSILWNLNPDLYDSNGNRPVIRMGFNF